VFDHIAGAEAYMNNKAQDVSGITVPDPYTLVIHLDEPFGPFLSLLTLTNAYVVPEEEVERWGPDFSFHVVGTGPFLLMNWEHGSHVRLTAHANYFQGPPRISGIVYRIIPEALTTMVEFEMGNLDIIRIPASEFRRYSTHAVWQKHLVAQPSLNTYYLGLNCRKPPFNDRRLRQAVAYAIDREKMRTTVFEGRGVAAYGPVPPLLRDEMAPLQDAYQYDPQKSLELMKEAGCPSGFSFKITIAFQPETLDIVEVIQYYLKKVNIETSIIQLEWSSFKDAVARGETDAFWLSWWADYPDVENFLYPLFHSANHGAGGNRTFYRDLEVDRLIEAAQGAADDAIRFRAYAEAEKIVIESAPMVFFWHKTEYFLCQPRVNGFVPYPLSSSDKGTEIILDGEK